MTQIYMEITWPAGVSATQRMKNTSERQTRDGRLSFQSANPEADSTLRRWQVKRTTWTPPQGTGAKGTLAKIFKSHHKSQQQNVTEKVESSTFDEKPTAEELTEQREFGHCVALHPHWLLLQHHSTLVPFSSTLRLLRLSSDDSSTQI